VGDLFVTAYGDYGTGARLTLELPAGGGPVVTVPNPQVGSVLAQPYGTYVLDAAGDYHGAYEVSVSDSEAYDLQRSQPPTLNFGKILLGDVSTLSLTIVNTGTGTLTVSPAFSSSRYSIAATTPANCLAGTTPTQTCTVQIQVSGSVIGSYNDSLTLQTNARNDPIVPLEAVVTSADAPVLSLASGVYAAAQTVWITDAEPGAAIYYTTDGSRPTAVSTSYSGPIIVSSTERITAIAIIDGQASPTATAAYSIISAPAAKTVNLSRGFSSAGMQLNGDADLDGTSLRLTNGELLGAASAFYGVPLDIQSFTSYFTFQLTNPDADGFTFAIQNIGPTAVGSFGAALGYGGIAKSVAIKFDLHDNAGEGPNSTGVFSGGATPTSPSVNLTGTGINLHSGDPVLAQVAYDGVHLTLTLTDAVTLATWSDSFAIDIASKVGGSMAYVGFTGGTGSQSATQEILSWTYVAAAPVALPPAALPPALGSMPAYAAGFNAAGLVLNGSAAHAGTALNLTGDISFQAGSAFYAVPLNIQSFSTDFDFQSVDGVSDGITFTIQNNGAGALGAFGKALGYGGIGKSVAVKFDSHNNDGEGTSSTGLYVDGATPTTPAFDLNQFAYDLTLSFPFHVHLGYDGANLAMTIKYESGPGTDLPPATFSFPIDIPSTVGGNTAYVGFTGATGASISTQQILDWTFTNP
jgi:hypothetical protein